MSSAYAVIGPFGAGKTSIINRIYNTSFKTSTKGSGVTSWNDSINCAKLMVKKELTSYLVDTPGFEPKDEKDFLNYFFKICALLPRLNGIVYVLQGTRRFERKLFGFLKKYVDANNILVIFTHVETFMVNNTLWVDQDGNKLEKEQFEGFTKTQVCMDSTYESAFKLKEKNKESVKMIKEWITKEKKIINTSKVEKMFQELEKNKLDVAISKIYKEYFEIPVAVKIIEYVPILGTLVRIVRDIKYKRKVSKKEKKFEKKSYEISNLFVTGWEDILVKFKRIDELVEQIEVKKVNLQN